MSAKSSPIFSKTVSVVSTFILGLGSLSFLPIINSASVHAAGLLVINEFVPAPSNRTCSSFGNMETIELVNSGDTPIDYTTFSLRDKSGIVKLLTSGVTIYNATGGIVAGNFVPIGGYLVFKTSEGWLNNTTQSGKTPTDGVYLYDNGALVDSQDYNITDGAMSDVVFRRNGNSFSQSFQSSFGRSNNGIQDLNCSGKSDSSSSLSNSSLSSAVSSSNISSSKSSSLVSSKSLSSLPPVSSSKSSSLVSSSSSVSVNSSTTSSNSSSNSSISQFGNLKVCKEDNLQNKLSNWEFNVKNSSLNQNPINLIQKTQTSGTSSVVQTLSIDTKNSGLTPSIDLPAGNYSLKVSGKYTYGSFDGKLVEADAGYSFRPIGAVGGTNSWLSGDNLPSPFTGMLKVRANNQNLNFGAYNASSVYTTQISKGNGPINFSINDIEYSDNAGSLQVEITKIAETNGCTTFFNLPYGNYNLTETMQPNWSFVKANSNSEMLVKPDNSVVQTLSQNETTLTFVNKFTAPATSGSGTGQLYYGEGSNNNGGNILAPVTQTPSQNNPQNNTNSQKSTAVKGAEDNEKDTKNSSNSSSTITNNSTSQNNSQVNTANNLPNIEYRIKLVENDKNPIETKVISGNGSNSSLIRTGGNENLQFTSGLMLIFMGTGLYFSFKQKNIKKSTEEKL